MMEQNFHKLHYCLVDSTNLRLRELYEGGEVEPLTYLRADEQTGGYGRSQRLWDSARGNIYVSFLVPSPPIAEASRLGFMMSLAIFDILGEFLDSPPLRLKWPNDILYGDAKLAGLLLEVVGDSVIIGVGININSSPEIAGRETTYALRHARDSQSHDILCNFEAHDTLTASFQSHNILCDFEAHDTLTASFQSHNILCDFEALCDSLGERFLKHCESDFADILALWCRRGHGEGELLSVHVGGKLVRGTYEGLRSDGALLLRCEGEVLEIVSADVFLGIEG